MTNSIYSSFGNSPKYHDIAGMTELKARAEQNPDASLREVAQQFESIFVNMMLKSARQATMDGGLFSSSAIKTYESMFDQQLALTISSGRNGIGLADLIVKQLESSQRMVNQEQSGGG